MKKLMIVSAFFIALSACGGDASTTEATDANTSDSVGLTNPTAIDTTKHPSGMVNSSVISTDTAAINMQNTIDKANSKKNK